MSNVPFLMEAFQKASSTSAPISEINAGFALKLISENSKEFTSSMISYLVEEQFDHHLSNTLYSHCILVGYGKLLIQSQHDSLIHLQQMTSSGVGRRSSKRTTWISFADNTSATNLENVSLLCLQSYAMATLIF